MLITKLGALALILMTGACASNPGKWQLPRAPREPLRGGVAEFQVTSYDGETIKGRVLLGATIDPLVIDGRLIESMDVDMDIRTLRACGKKDRFRYIQFGVALALTPSTGSFGGRPVGTAPHRATRPAVRDRCTAIPWRRDVAVHHLDRSPSSRKNLTPSRQAAKEAERERSVLRDLAPLRDPSSLVSVEWVRWPSSGVEMPGIQRQRQSYTLSYWLFIEKKTGLGPDCLEADLIVRALDGREAAKIPIRVVRTDKPPAPPDGGAPAAPKPPPSDAGAP